MTLLGAFLLGVFMGAVGLCILLATIGAKASLKKKKEIKNDQATMALLMTMWEKFLKDQKKEE